MPYQHTRTLLLWIWGVLCVGMGGGGLVRAQGTMASERPGVVSFRNEVMAVLSKGGCASGPCHGNRSGKGGFRLSLRGEDPDADYETLLSDVAGRRLDHQNPAQSLLLLKPLGDVPHEGRVRFDRDSLEYAVLKQWIESGAMSDLETAPRVTRLHVEPADVVLSLPDDRVHVRVLARFSDGKERDVTRLAVFEPVSPIVLARADGELRFTQPGETTVLVRYLDKQAAVPVIQLPIRDRVWSWQMPAPANIVDEAVFAKLKKLRLVPAPRCSDAEYIRRLTLDLCGTVPSAAEAREFVRDTNPEKRAVLVDRWLKRPEFAEYWALKWADLFRVEERALDRKGLQLFHTWLVQQMADNTPLDVFARSILTARGSTYAVPAANWFRAHRTPVERSEAVAQVFLGTRLQCAQCHNHPYEHWTQNDYHDWTAAFARVDYRVLENRRRDDNDSHEFIGEQAVFVSSTGEHRHPKSGKACTPRLLGAGQGIDTDAADPLAPLAEWLTQPENPLFARVQANRIWYHLMGRGLVDPVDDFRSTNPASHPELLEALTRELVSSQFDVRHLIRRITASRTYQASWQPVPGQPEDPLNYSHTFVRRLTAEQVLDAASLAAGVPLEMGGRLDGLRAAQLAGPSAGNRRGRSGTEDRSLDQFLRAFGKPTRQLTTECERTCEPTMTQAFQFLSGPVVQEFVSSKRNRLDALLASGATPEAVVDELYWATLTRAPSAPEARAFASALTSASGAEARRAVAEDLLWGLLNAKEFVLRR